MVYGVILAAGEGIRMGTSIPKQYLKLKDKPIIIWTITTFLNSNLFDKIYITIGIRWKDYAISLLNKYLQPENLKKIEIYTCKSKNRTICLRETINAIINTSHITPGDIVISHDAVRPFVSYDILKDCIIKVSQNQVAMAAVPCVETIYISNINSQLIKTQKREKCFLGQSPHGCYLNLLYHTLNSFSNKELEEVTAISQLFLSRNIKIKISHGEYSNFKITTPKDLAFAEFYIENYIINSNIKK